MNKAAGTGKFRKFLYHDTTVGYIIYLPCRLFSDLSVFL